MNTKPTVQELGRECGRLLRAKQTIAWFLAKGEESGDIRYFTIAGRLIEIYNEKNN